LPFIVPDLIYAYEKTECVTKIPNGFTINLQAWLLVDAYLRLGIGCVLFLVAICTCNSLSVGILGLAYSTYLIPLHGVFSLVWNIVGSVLFWGKLDPTGICYGPVHDYVFALLIITYIIVCCSLFSKSFVNVPS
jgi:hypothetical protein